MSSKSRYNQMFKEELLELSGMKNQVADYIRQARRDFKRDDRIVWFLRFVKYDVITEAYLKHPEKISKKYLSWINNFKEEFIPSDVLRAESGGVQKLDWSLNLIYEQIKHYIDLDLPDIKKYEFANKNFSDLLSELGAFETEHLERLEEGERRSVEEYGTILIDLGDDLAWFDLGVPGCRIEGDAMGHCGNGSGRYGNNVLSLRSRDPYRPGNWIPHITVIMNDTKTGELGEIKGYGNNKPSEKYHDAMIALLLHESVKILAGGGYKPENNFNLDDLSKENEDLLIREKPLLYGAYGLWKRNNYSTNDIITELFIEEYGAELSKANDDSEEYLIEIAKYDNAIDMAECLNLEQLKWYAEKLEDGSYDFSEMDADFDMYESEVSEKLEEFINLEKNKDIKEALVHYIIKNESDYIEENELDLSSFDALYEVMKENSEMLFILKLAANQAVKNGSESEVYSAINEQREGMIDAGLIIIKDKGCEEIKIKLNEGDFFDAMRKIEEQLGYEGSRYELLDLLKENINNDNIFEIKDIEVPYYGFSGFDEDSIIEELSYRLGEELYETINELAEIKSNEVLVFPDSVNKEIKIKQIMQRTSDAGLAM